MKNTPVFTQHTKKPLFFSLKNFFFRLKVHLFTTPSFLRICMIFLCYCTAISFFIMGIRLLQEEHLLEKKLQLQTVKAAASGNGTPLSVLYLQKEQKLQTGIAKQVIRLHVIANSDSAEDQELKLMVRDEIIAHMQNSLKNINSQKRAEEKIASQLAWIKTAAADVLKSHGCTYEVNVSLKDRFFPVKQYGDLTFPAGVYRALCIEIGDAAGHNWWCVLFPSLCFVDEATAVVPEESKERLRESLTEEEYHALTTEPEPRFLLYDWISGQ